MLSPRQIRAARGLLGWDANQLAEKAKVTARTVSNIESGRTQAQAGSMENIAQVLMDNGVEFLPNDGVSIKQQGFQMLIGQEGLQQFFDGVYEHVRKYGGKIVQFGVDEKQFLMHLGKKFSADYVGRMTKVSRERKDLNVRAIVCDQDTAFLASDYNEYRWISEDIFQAVPFYIYGENLAIMDFETVVAPTIFVLKSAAISNSYRKQFEALWKIARATPHEEKGK